MQGPGGGRGRVCGRSSPRRMGGQGECRSRRADSTQDRTLHSRHAGWPDGGLARSVLTCGRFGLGSETATASEHALVVHARRHGVECHAEGRIGRRPLIDGAPRPASPRGHQHDDGDERSEPVEGEHRIHAGMLEPRKPVLHPSVVRTGRVPPPRRSRDVPQLRTEGVRRGLSCLRAMFLARASRVVAGAGQGHGVRAERGPGGNTG